MGKPKIQTETMWQSSEENPFMTVKKARGYYYYALRLGKDSVFFVLFDGETGKYGLVTESKPPLDEAVDAHAMMTTAFGGSLDMDKSMVEIVQIEVLEEAGYNVPIERINSIGATMVSTQMSQIAHGYVVDVTGIAKTEQTEGEDSESVCDGVVLWMTLQDVIRNSDWKSIFAVVKLGELMDELTDAQNEQA